MRNYVYIILSVLDDLPILYQASDICYICFLVMVGHKHMCLYPSLFHDEKMQNLICPWYNHMCLSEFWRKCLTFAMK